MDPNEALAVVFTFLFAAFSCLVFAYVAGVFAAAT